MYVTWSHWELLISVGTRLKQIVRPASMDKMEGLLMSAQFEEVDILLIYLLLMRMWIIISWTGIGTYVDVATHFIHKVVLLQGTLSTRSDVIRWQFSLYFLWHRICKCCGMWRVRCFYISIICQIFCIYHSVLQMTSLYSSMPSLWLSKVLSCL